MSTGSMRSAKRLRPSACSSAAAAALMPRVGRGTSGATVRKGVALGRLR